MELVREMSKKTRVRQSEYLREAVADVLAHAETFLFEPLSFESQAFSADERVASTTTSVVVARCSSTRR